MAGVRCTLRPPVNVNNPHTNMDLVPAREKSIGFFLLFFFFFSLALHWNRTRQYTLADETPSQRAGQGEKRSRQPSMQ